MMISASANNSTICQQPARRM